MGGGTCRKPLSSDEREVTGQTLTEPHCVRSATIIWFPRFKAVLTYIRKMSSSQREHDVPCRGTKQPVATVGVDHQTMYSCHRQKLRSSTEKRALIKLVYRPGVSGLGSVCLPPPCPLASENKGFFLKILPLLELFRISYIFILHNK